MSKHLSGHHAAGGGRLRPGGWLVAGLALASPALPATEPASGPAWQSLAVELAAPAAGAPTGLPGVPAVRYRVIRPGTAAVAAASASVPDVWLRFTARRLDGNLVMQAPQDPGAPAQHFTLGELAPGLRAAVARMPEGARWEVEVPYALGPLRHNPRFLRGDPLLYDLERSPAPTVKGTATPASAPTPTPTP